MTKRATATMRYETIGSRPGAAHHTKALLTQGFRRSLGSSANVRWAARERLTVAQFYPHTQYAY